MEEKRQVVADIATTTKLLGTKERSCEVPLTSLEEYLNHVKGIQIQHLHPGTGIPYELYLSVKTNPATDIPRKAIDAPRKIMFYTTLHVPFQCNVVRWSQDLGNQVYNEANPQVFIDRATAFAELLVKAMCEPSTNQTVLGKPARLVCDDRDLGREITAAFRSMGLNEEIWAVMMATEEECTYAEKQWHDFLGANLDAGAGGDPMEGVETEVMGV